MLIFSHPWETVVAAALKKYPNPLNEAVLGTDIIDRKIINGTLYTHRLVVSEFKFPRTAQAVSFFMVQKVTRTLTIFFKYFN